MYTRYRYILISPFMGGCSLDSRVANMMPRVRERWSPISRPIFKLASGHCFSNQQLTPVM